MDVFPNWFGLSFPVFSENPSSSYIPTALASESPVKVDWSVTDAFDSLELVTQAGGIQVTSKLHEQQVVAEKDGSVLWAFTVKGYNRFTIPARRLAHGFYLVRLTGPNGLSVARECILVQP